MRPARQPPLDSTRTGAKSRGNLEVQGPGALPSACRSHEEERPAAQTPWEGTGRNTEQGLGRPPSGTQPPACLCRPPLDTGVTAQRRTGAPICVLSRERGRTSPRELPRQWRQLDQPEHRATRGEDADLGRAWGNRASSRADARSSHRTNRTCFSREGDGSHPRTKGRRGRQTCSGTSGLATWNV